MSSTEDSDGDEIFFKRNGENDSNTPDNWIDAPKKIGYEWNKRFY